ncbi:Tat pathway signal protein [Streptomyces sp. NPDC002399]
MNRMKRTRPVLSALVATALTAGVFTTLTSEAAAAPQGRACLFLDKQGAVFKGTAYGHVAWAIRDPKNRNHWIWGATENAEGDAYTKPGRNNGTWIQGGTWRQMRGEDKGKRALSLVRYDAYRCINTAGGDLAGAQRTYKQMRDNGYAIFTNNCLTKSIGIFRKYSPALSTAHLPTGYVSSPNYYFYAVLNKARGWERASSY